MNEIVHFLSTYGLSLQQASMLGVGTLLVLGLGLKKTLKRKKKSTTVKNKLGDENIFNNGGYSEFMSMQTEDVNQFLIPREINETEEDYQSPKPEDILPVKRGADKTLNVGSKKEIIDAYYIEAPSESPEEEPSEEDLEFLSLNLPNVTGSVTSNENISNFKHSDEKLGTDLSDFLLKTSTKSDKKPLAIPKKSIEVIEDIKQSKEDFLDFDLGDSPLTFMNGDDLKASTEKEVIKPIEIIKTPDFKVSSKEIELEKEKSKELEAELKFMPEIKEPQVSYKETEPQFFTHVPTLTEVAIDVDKEQKELSSRESFVPPVTPVVNEKLFPETKVYHKVIEDALYWDSLGEKEKTLLSLEKAVTLIQNVRVNFHFKIAIQSYKSVTNKNPLSSIINQFYLIEREKILKEEKEKLEKRRAQQLKEKEALELEKTLSAVPVSVLVNNGIQETQDISQMSLGEEPIILEGFEPISAVQNENADHSAMVESALTKEEKLFFEHEAQEIQTQEVDMTPLSFQEVIDSTPNLSSASDKPVLDLNEFTDTETQEQFLHAFGDMFTVKEGESSLSLSDSPSTTIEEVETIKAIDSFTTNEHTLKFMSFTQEKANEPEPVLTVKHKLWVNWAIVDNGKMNMKNGSFEIAHPWGTELGAKELQAQLELIAGTDQVSIMSAFPVN